MLDAGPDVLNHNTETVPRLYRMARSGGRYARTLELLDRSRTIAPDIPTKTGLMVGLGEERDELLATFADLRGVGCQILTIGQYLRPSPEHAPMARYYTPGRVRRPEASGARHGLRSRRVRPARPQLLSRARNRRRLRSGNTEVNPHATLVSGDRSHRHRAAPLTAPSCKGAIVHGAASAAIANGNTATAISGGVTYRFNRALGFGVEFARHFDAPPLTRSPSFRCCEDDWRRDNVHDQHPSGRCRRPRNVSFRSSSPAAASPLSTRSYGPVYFAAGFVNPLSLMAFTGRDMPHPAGAHQLRAYHRHEHGAHPRWWCQSVARRHTVAVDVRPAGSTPAGERCRGVKRRLVALV